MQCLPPGTRLSDHLQPVVCAVYLNDIPLCHENRVRVPRPSLPRAGDAIHPALGKGVVWFTRLTGGLLKRASFPLPVDRVGLTLGLALAKQRAHDEESITAQDFDWLAAASLLKRESYSNQGTPSNSLLAFTMNKL